MIGDCNDGGRGIVYDIADWRYCNALEGTIKVPMLKPMRIALDDRCFIAMYVISVIAVTVRTVIFVVVFVMVGFTRGILAMDVRMVSSAVPMMNQAHDARPIPTLSLSIATSPFDSTISTRHIDKTVSRDKALVRLCFRASHLGNGLKMLPTEIVRGCVGTPFAKDFDSQFDSHAFGQGRINHTQADCGPYDSSRFGRGRTRSNRTFTSITRVQMPSRTPRVFALSMGSDLLSAPEFRYLRLRHLCDLPTPTTRIAHHLH